MKTFITMIAITLIAFTVRASDFVPYIAMPAGIGYATDAKGTRQPNAFCVRDAMYAPTPQVPWNPNTEIWSADSSEWKRFEGRGVYRLNIDLNTGRVTQVTIIKPGSKVLDSISTTTFKCWVFRPGKWKEVIISTSMQRKWKGVVAEAL